jgi:hypothetical protein
VLFASSWTAVTLFPCTASPSPCPASSSSDSTAGTASSTGVSMMGPRGPPFMGRPDSPRSTACTPGWVGSTPGRCERRSLMKEVSEAMVRVCKTTREGRAEVMRRRHNN